MNTRKLILLAASLIVIAGCCRENKQRQEMISHTRETDKRLAQWANEAAMENAIVSQHTLFPYHFMPNSDQLNELGQRDLGVLTRHYQQQPGSLNVRRGQTPDNLYRARVDHVVAVLHRAGVDSAEVAISDGPSGGRSIPSEEIIHILIKETHRTPPSFYREPMGAAGIARGEE